MTEERIESLKRIQKVHQESKGYAPANSGTRCRGEGGQIAMLIKFFPGLVPAE